MSELADLWIEEPPPESGVRPITRPAPILPRAPQAALPAPDPGDREILEEVGKQVLVEVWDLMIALSPLQGAWLRPGIGHIGAIAIRMLGWEIDEAPAEKAQASRGEVLRRRWPELVPGYAAMDRLLDLMVDWICR